MQEIFDACQHVFVLLWAWAFLPCIFSSIVTSEKTEIEFRAFRLQQYEYAGKMYGSKSWKVFYEAVSLNRFALRKCVITNWRELMDKELETTIGSAVGAVLVIIPEDVNALTDSDQKSFLEVEKKFFNFFTDQAIYFVPNSSTLNFLLKSVSIGSQKSPTAFQQLYNAVAADNFQISSENTVSTNLITTKQYNVIGQLNAAEHGRPYLVIVAHYDTHAAIPALGMGVDSNGSGVAALFELLAILSQFYSTTENRPKYNIVFLLSAAGKFNYQGSRQWIDEFQDKHSDAKIALTLCLDSLARGDSLYLHVSKALNEGTVSHKLFQNLQSFAANKRSVKVVAKKINLAAERLAWEHEIFNVRRIYALTLSHFENPADPMRTSILDNKNALDVEAFQSNVKIIANAVVSLIFNLDVTLCQNENATNSDHSYECSILRGVESKRLLAWIDAFASTPRSIASLTPQSSAKLVANMQAVVKRFAEKVSTVEVPIVDYTIFGITEDKILASIVKPAVFELFLAAIISLYLFCAYYFAQNTQSILERTVMTMKKNRLGLFC